MATFSQNPFGVSFSYPADWKGPEVYTYENGFRYEIGTDTVYPYGTDPTERIHTKKNNYYIVVQYDKKPANITATEFRKTQVHLKQYDTLVKLNPGETIEDTRSLVIKVRNINYAGVTGVEYISTLSKSAQTEMSYTREAVLFDTDMNVLSIRGYADDVEVTDNTNWKKDYEAIDAKYLSEFTALTNSVAFYSDYNVNSESRSTSSVVLILRRSQMYTRRPEVHL
jgi:hypothetical protein